MGSAQQNRGDKRRLAKQEDHLQSGSWDGAGVCHSVSHRVHQPCLQAAGQPLHAQCLTVCPIVEVPLNPTDKSGCGVKCDKYDVLCH